MRLVEVHTNWPEQPQLSQKKKKKSITGTYGDGR